MARTPRLGYITRLHIAHCLAMSTLCGSLYLLSSCSTVSTDHDGPPPFEVNAEAIPDAVPTSVTKSAYGNAPAYTIHGKRYYVLPSAKGYDKTGVASWYGTKFHGHLTSTREPYNMLAMTAASPELPIPCFARVTNLDNGKSVVVKVNDRGPFANNRIMDLSYAAAKKLGYAARGTAHVRVTSLLPDMNPTIQLAAVPRATPTPTQHTVPRGPTYYLQVAAFHDRTHAERLKAKLNQHITEPVLITQLHGTRLYRVQIGPLAHNHDANGLRQRLHEV